MVFYSELESMPVFQELGLAPIRAHCDFPSRHTTIGKTVKVQVGKCDSVQCFEYQHTYDAFMQQIVGLMHKSEECSQKLQFDCLLAPLWVSLIT